MISQEEYCCTLKRMGFTKISQANIRQCVAISKALEPALGQPFVHMEFGIPGLPACQIGIDAEIQALQNGVANVYPNIAGEAPLKQASSRFLEAFLNVKVTPECCIPTVGSMQASNILFLMMSQFHPTKDTVLFINPGFPAHHTQTQIYNIRTVSFDVYNYRGERLRQRIEEELRTGRIAAIFYSNPNNPSWVCLTEDELRSIGELATAYDAIVIEDLAYITMDFRQDLSKPFMPPYPATVAHYTDNYILMLSASKIFSYAGQRIAISVLSPKVFAMETPLLKQKYDTSNTFGGNFIFTYLYSFSSGTAHSPQYALAAMMNAAVDGQLDFVGQLREYGRRAAKAKDIFLRHGFHIVYDKDANQPISDGFFFTIGCINPTTGQLMDSELLLARLMRCGVCAIALSTTGSLQQGVRCCVSKLNSDDDFCRLDAFLDDFCSNQE